MGDGGGGPPVALRDGWPGRANTCAAGAHTGGRPRVSFATGGLAWSCHLCAVSTPAPGYVREHPRNDLVGSADSGAADHDGLVTVRTAACWPCCWLRWRCWRLAGLAAAGLPAIDQRRWRTRRAAGHHGQRCGGDAVALLDGGRLAGELIGRVITRRGGAGAMASRGVRRGVLIIGRAVHLPCDGYAPSSAAGAPYDIAAIGPGGGCPPVATIEAGGVAFGCAAGHGLQRPEGSGGHADAGAVGTEPSLAAINDHAAVLDVVAAGQHRREAGFADTDTAGCHIYTIRAVSAADETAPPAFRPGGAVALRSPWYGCLSFHGCPATVPRLGGCTPLRVLGIECFAAPVPRGGDELAIRPEGDIN